MDCGMIVLGYTIMANQCGHVTYYSELVWVMSPRDSQHTFPEARYELGDDGSKRVLARGVRHAPRGV